MPVVSLFVRLWVEIPLERSYLHPVPVSLFVRLWVEISTEQELRVHPYSQPLREAVSWNLNDYADAATKNRQPLREAVSWNDEEAMGLTTINRQPLREAVSWNINMRTHTANIIVSLFVRLWVEMIYASWGVQFQVVSLFVRLWVEMNPIQRLAHSP